MLSDTAAMDGTDVLVGLSVSSYTDAAQEPKVKKNTAVQAYQYFRHICSWRLLNHDAPLMLGGPGVVVHIDKSLFIHKPKVWYTCMTSVVSVIVNIFIMMSSRTIMGVHPLPSVGQHRVVNHSLHFVDPATSVHTHHAESY